MKKATFIFICLLAASTIFAQVTRDKVVVEVGTGTWCQYCPGAALGVDDLVANGWPVAAIENHNGDPFANQYSDARNSFYGISGYPTAFFDGVLSVVGGDHTQSMYSSYYPKVQARMNVPSPVTISVTGTHTGLMYNINVVVTKVSNITGSNIKLQTTLTESNIVYAWQGQNKLDYVDRLMVPDQNGTTLDFTNSNVLEIPLSFVLQSTWVLNNMELVVFVQTNSNKEILNGFKVKLPFLMPPPPPLAANFSSDDTISCEGYQVQYDNQSTGNPTAWYWEFPGGTPDTSREENPVIVYNTAGKYDVTLIAYRGTHSDTTYKPEFVEVYPLPAVTFDAMEDQCINYPPVELTQGLPAGGTYSGPGVDNGFFHPDVAGVGTHTLTYTYADEYGCENTAQQDVIVDACTGVPENSGVQIVTVPNPTNGSFKLSLAGTEQNVSVRVMNSVGKVVYEQGNMQLNGTFSATIDLSNQASGLYYIQVKGSDNTYFRKVVLQK
jgi:PKD repeat protein